MVAQAIAGSLAAKRWLARYIADAIGETRSNDLSAEEWLRSLENQIDLTLLADYSWSRKVPLVEGYLASVLRRRALLGQSGEILAGGRD
jgi:hypothetical protein